MIIIYFSCYNINIKKNYFYLGLSDINSKLFPDMIELMYTSFNVELIMIDYERIEHQEN